MPGIAVTGIFCSARVHRPGKEAVRLDVMTCNIGDLMGKRALHGTPLVQYLSSGGIPDVLMLQELYGKKDTGELANALGLPHYTFLGDHGGNGMGIAIFSRFPLSQIQTLAYKNSKRGAGAIRAVIEKDGQAVTLVNTHLDRISGVALKNGLAEVDRKTLKDMIKNELWEDTDRTRMVRELLDWLKKDPPINSEHLILGGDFNTIPLSKTIRLIEQSFDDVLWPSLDYFKGTYTKLDFPVTPRIDYLFVSPDLALDSGKIISKSPGDHFPVRARVLIEG